jgi:mRNA-degrading endonuclease RelE of RelBE toxin-antitoxin system
MAKLVVHKRAASYLRKLPPDQKEKIKVSLRQVRDFPSLPWKQENGR